MVQMAVTWGMMRAAGLAVVLALAALRAEAGTREDEVVAQLVAEGYAHVRVETTWLGRIRIVGLLDGRLREIVLHPTSGEVLRDYTAPAVTMMANDEGGDEGSAAVSVASTVQAPQTRPGVAAAAKPGSPDVLGIAVADDPMAASAGVSQGADAVQP